MAKKEETEIRKKINTIYEENEYANLQQNKNRARSLTVGTAFGGAIEVNMRGDYHSLWCILNPVEAIEIAEQLAAAAGVQIAMRPKNDFSAWRGWDVDNIDYVHWKGAAPWQVAPENRHNKELNATEEPKQLPPSKEEAKKEFKRRVKETLTEETDEEKSQQPQKRSTKKRVAK